MPAVVCNKFSEMKQTFIISLLFILIIFGCKKDPAYLNDIVGKWQLKKSYWIIDGTYYPPLEEQNIREFKNNGQAILYNYLFDTIAQSQYEITDSSLILIGEDFKFEWEYYIQEDTLVLHQDFWEPWADYYKHIE